MEHGSTALAVLKSIGGPGSLGFLALCLGIGLVAMYVWPRNRRLGRAWFWGVSAGYLVLGLPVVANAIADRLSRLRAGFAEIPQPLDALIVFDGDNRRGRVRETAAIFRATSPRMVWVLGDRWIVENLIDAGVPAEQIVQNENSPTTRHQMAWVASFQATYPASHVGIVVSRVQLPRALALAESLKVTAQIISSPIDVEPPTRGFMLFVPTYTALRVSRDALYEHVALRYYRRKGWIR